MGKPSFKVNSHYNKIFDDLEKYLEFCRSYGYVYDEKDLYKDKSNSYRNYQKYITGKQVKNMWEADGK